MSRLPEWMRDPQPPERTTLSWEIEQSLRRNRFRQWAAARWEWWQNRSRITARFPWTTAVLAWLISLAVAVAIYYLLLLGMVVD
ncbi:hypothetical protein [Allorhizocola rhizosphaerae]|uniref:hypothetical protein n=1 Tax=Allorhizocola rhizosphaerae TaxID=1872709 RepID=UPI000E3EC26B|nr:hypothetical protein [Allorhizocola rhizosphaerae]